MLRHSCRKAARQEPSSKQGRPPPKPTPAKSRDAAASAADERRHGAGAAAAPPAPPPRRAPPPRPYPSSPPPVAHLYRRNAPLRLRRPPPARPPLRGLLPRRHRPCASARAAGWLLPRRAPGRAEDPPEPSVPGGRGRRGGGQGGRHPGRWRAAAHPLGRGDRRPAEVPHQRPRLGLQGRAARGGAHLHVLRVARRDGGGEGLPCPRRRAGASAAVHGGPVQ